LKVIEEVNSIRVQIEEQKKIISIAKKKAEAAKSEQQKIQKEMVEFKNNKDSKLRDIKVSACHFMKFCITNS
jgi:structural maintenance of chromosome 2